MACSAEGGQWTEVEYVERVKPETRRWVEAQERWGFYVFVDGDFDRADLVEFFSTQLAGFVLTQSGWVQSCNSRCVKSPIIFADNHRPMPMTLKYTAFAQSCTQRPIKRNADRSHHLPGMELRAR